VGDYEEIWENINFFETEVFDILDRLATFEIPDLKPIPHNRIRQYFFRRLFKEVWIKNKKPTSTSFINFCVDALIDADDPLEYSTVKTLIENVPRDFWFEESIKKNFSK
jgi:hypothetical protein